VTLRRREAWTKVFSSLTATSDLSCLRSMRYSMAAWEGYLTGICRANNVTVSLRRCSTHPIRPFLRARPLSHRN
jgi:hypothetical protein